MGQPDDSFLPPPPPIAEPVAIPAVVFHDFTVIGEHGRVISTGRSNMRPPETEGLILEEQAPADHWWDGAAFVPIGEQPGPWHVYDWPTHQWVDGQTLEATQATKWEEIKAKRNELEEGGFPYLGRVIDSDPVSVQRISIAERAARAASSAGEPFSIVWTCADNSTLTLDAEGMTGMPVALAMYGDHLHATARALRAQIGAATTIQAVEALSWPA